MFFSTDATLLSIRWKMYYSEVSWVLRTFLSLISQRLNWLTVFWLQLLKQCCLLLEGSWAIRIFFGRAVKKLSDIVCYFIVYVNLGRSSRNRWNTICRSRNRFDTCVAICLCFVRTTLPPVAALPEFVPEELGVEAPPVGVTWVCPDGVVLEDPFAVEFAG